MSGDTSGHTMGWKCSFCREELLSDHCDRCGPLASHGYTLLRDEDVERLFPEHECEQRA